MATIKEKSYITAGIANPEVAQKILDIIDWYEAGGGIAGVVTSVNGHQGTVILTSDDISEGVTNKYYTDTRAKAAAVINSTLGNETDKAASVAAMKSYVMDAQPDLSGYYDKAEVDVLLDAKLDQADLDQEIADREAADLLLIPLTQKGASNGVATLDGGGKVPASQLPSTVMELIGEYNATTNTPTLVDGIGDAGNVYEVTVAGTQDFGSGPIDFNLGDWVVYGADGVWYKSINSNEVTSVNGKLGIVVLDTDDIDQGVVNKYYDSSLFDSDLATKDTDDLDEGSINLYFTDSRAHAALATTISDLSDDISQETLDRMAEDAILETAILNEANARNIAVTAVQTNLTNHINNPTAAHAATTISNTPFGNLAAANVQGALNELQTDIDSRALDSDLDAHINAINNAHEASSIGFDNTDSGLAAINVQTAIDEIVENSVISVNGEIGVVVLDTDDVAQGVVNKYYTSSLFNADLATKTTDDLDEGATNLYFTEDRVLAAVSRYIDFSLANNQSIPQDVTDLQFDNTVSGFELFATVEVIASTNLHEAFTLVGINRGATWEIYPIATGTDSTGVVFSITSLGQVQYSTPAYTGFVSATLSYRPISSSASITSGVDSVNGQTGIVVLSKANIGLGNVDNTSDDDKPLSIATQGALNTKITSNLPIVSATKTKITYDMWGLVTAGVDATTADITDSSNKRYVTDSDLTKLANTSGVNTGDQDLSAINAHIANTSNPHGVTKAQVGLSNVDNTSDDDKPISTLQQAEFDLKVNKAGDTMTGDLAVIGKLTGVMDFIFGTGEDGTGSISSNIALSRSTYYTNLTITSTGILRPSGWAVYVNGTLNIQASGQITSNGNNAGNGGASATGGSAGALVTANELGGSTVGGTGAAGVNGAGATAASIGGAICLLSATAGNGASGGAGAGGGGGGTRAGSATTYRPVNIVPAIPYYLARNGGQSAPGGGSGGGSGSAAGAGGGGGGSGGGVMLIYCKELINNGSILARGGNGGNGGNASNTNAGGGGGGGGGTGGLIVIIAGKVTTLGTISVSGGTGGTGGTGNGTGVAGSNGTSGGNGKYRVYDMSTGTWVVS